MPIKKKDVISLLVLVRLYKIDYKKLEVKFSSLSFKNCTCIQFSTIKQFANLFDFDNI